MTYEVISTAILFGIGVLIFVRLCFAQGGTMDKKSKLDKKKTKPVVKKYKKKAKTQGYKIAPRG